MSLGYNSNRPVRSNNMNILGNVTSAATFSKKKPVINHNTSSSSQPIPVSQLQKTFSNQDQVITQRRLEYVETQLKKTQVEFKEHVTKLQEHKKSFKEDVNNLDTMNMQPIKGVAKMDIVSLVSGRKLYNNGDVVPLIYPMKKDGTKTLMRTVIVNEVTAQISYEWIMVFDMESGKPIRPVTNFKLSI